MAVHYNNQDHTFTLHTKSTTYQMQVTSLGILEHLYYGKRVPDGSLDYLQLHADVGFSPNPYEAGTDRTYSLDNVSQEYPSRGVGDFRIASMEVQQADGSRATDFRFQSFDIIKAAYSIQGLPAVYSEDGEGETLVITMKDIATDLELDLLYGVFEEQDMLTRTVRLRNGGSAPVWIEKVHSACLDIPFGQWQMIHFHGRHNMERMMERVPLMHGTFSIGSRRGTSSHQHNPSAIFCSPHATESAGECYGIQLLYSGNFTIEAEQDQMSQLRISAGISPDDFRWQLMPDQTFEAPQVLMTYSDHGYGLLSRRYHHMLRHNLCRGRYKLADRPVLINNWEATYFDFDEEKILEIASQAAELGIDMMVLDDGWFGKRDEDVSGLGDWYVNPEKLKHGLPWLAERIHEKGMKFGLWFEPEMISEDSELYRAHPDWAIQIPGRKPARSRMQLVLDMGRKEVRDYLYERISGILDTANIEYIKWDFNRSICDVYSHGLPFERQGECAHRFVLGIYELMENLVNDYPHVLFEGCSGGGGRFDAAMLYYTPQIWCSDDTDAVERLEIQYGTSFFYPVSSMGSHVSACPNHQTGRSTPLQTRSVVAMAGTFGYELDLSLLSEEEKEAVSRQVEQFKQFRSLIHGGEYYRLAGPYDDSMVTAWEFAAGDGSEALVNMVVTHVRANWLGFRIRLEGLVPEAEYRLECEGMDLSSRTYSGAALMYGGLALPMLCGDYPALQIYIRRV